MRRTIWFSLFCLVALAVLIGVRAFSPFASKDAKVPDSLEDEDIVSLAKTDKLIDNEDELRPDKVTVKTVKILVPPPPAKETSPYLTKEHWRPAYARMRDKTHHATHHHRMRILSRR
jgi:hypothetical protein